MMKVSGAINPAMRRQMRCQSTISKDSPATLIIGAAGAVGKRLTAALSAQGTRVIASDRMDKLPGTLTSSLGPGSIAVGGVDVTDSAALMNLFKEFECP